VSVEAIHIVKERGGTVSVDASSVAIIEDFGVARFAELLETLGPTVLLCNRDEADLLGVSIAGGLRGVEVTVIKDGGNRAVAVDDSGIVASAPAQGVSFVRDTTGAGDAFAAGFITEMMVVHNAEAALVNGHRVAAGVLTRLTS
jgi:sugar/nucleoside kinase (ribokinase family)